MDIVTAIKSRKSIRGFQTTPVSKETLHEILSIAARAISTNNAQPWEFIVVTGEPLDAIRRENMVSFAEKQPVDYDDAPIFGPYLERARAVGKQLFEAMEIERGDREKRTEWLKRGFRFFDAPAVILLCMDESLDEAAYRFDMGCVAQNICLTAMGYGLGTCVENQAITYQTGLKKHLSLPNKRLVCGIAIGYADDGFAANHVVSCREEIDHLVSWYGFT